jgi:hypothetical protein
MVKRINEIKVKILNQTYNQAYKKHHIIKHTIEHICKNKGIT